MQIARPKQSGPSLLCRAKQLTSQSFVVHAILPASLHSIMPSEQDLRQVQETEIEALRAIFCEDFEQIRTRSSAKTLATPFELRLKIRTEEVELQDRVRINLR
ncbi:hypothetical protein PCASD_19858, partial [Puccinia coronata f. sp. avenae]